ncbi:MAG: hypothetical protein JXA18_16540 [Chitinispirillaceae bacterium]|nr:hypothetical protein [Chitinispirillaceae bacterium]
MQKKRWVPGVDNALQCINRLEAEHMCNAVGFLRSAAFRSDPMKRKILDGLKDIILDNGKKQYAYAEEDPGESGFPELYVPGGLKPGQRANYRRLLRASTIEQAAIKTVLSIIGPAKLLDPGGGWLPLIDRSGMLGRLGNWPAHIGTMHKRGVDAAAVFTAKHGDAPIAKIKIFGLGGSAAPHDIAREIIANREKSACEIEIVRADSPHGDFTDEHTLALFCSFSGDTEETLHCYDRIRHRTNLIAAMARGGKLEKMAREAGMPFMKIPSEKGDPAYVMQPRESVCLQCIATLLFLAAIGLKAGAAGALEPRLIDVSRLARLVASWRKRFGPSRKFDYNPAKRLAFFMLYGFHYTDEHLPAFFDVWDKKIPYVIGDYHLRALVHEAATQLRERSKICAVEGIAPEELHNSVEAIRAVVESSAASLERNPYVYLFLDSIDSERRIGFRLAQTRNLVLRNRGAYAVLNAEGETALERALFLTYFNAHMTTYAAVINGFDPLPVPTMSWIKKVMAELPRNCGKEKVYAEKKHRTLELRRQPGHFTLRSGIPV